MAQGVTAIRQTRSFYLSGQLVVVNIKKNIIDQYYWAL